MSDIVGNWPMTPEERELLEEAAEFGRKNNAILKKIHRAMLWQRVIHVLYWVVVIGAALGAYYIAQPYIELLRGIYGSVGTGLGGLPDISTLLGGTAQ